MPRGCPEAGAIVTMAAVVAEEVAETTAAAAAAAAVSSKPVGGPTGISWSELTPEDELSPSTSGRSK